MHTLGYKKQKEAVELYKQGKSTGYIQDILGVSQWFILTNLKKFGVSQRENPKRRYTVNDDFFENIDSEEKAYWLGFLYADGCNYMTHRANMVKLSLAEQDKDHLVKYKKAIQSSHPLNINTPKNPRHQRMFSVSVSSKKMCLDLSAVGCVPNKTFLLKFPNLDQNLKRHFLRGYFDGDGCLYFKVNRSIKASCDITSTMEMCLSITEILSEIDIKSRIIKRHKTRDNNNFSIKITNTKDALKLCSFLYSNAKVYLDRKYEKYQILNNLYANLSLQAS